MPAFSQTSLDRLATTHPDLQRLFKAVVVHFNCTVLCGRRDEAEQNEAFKNGHSTKRWPNSKHNALPPALSAAVDVAPYPIAWDDTARFRYFSGFVMGMAASMGIKIKSGGDWDMDTDLKDQGLIDLPHYEIVP